MVVETVKLFLMRLSVIQVTGDVEVIAVWEILVQRREVDGMAVQSPVYQVSTLVHFEAR